MFDISQGDVVRIRWTDAWEYSGWTLIETLEEILDSHHRENETVGFVLKVNTNYIAVLGSIGWDIENHDVYNGASCMVIPLKVINECEVLRKHEQDGE